MFGDPCLTSFEIGLLPDMTGSSVMVIVVNMLVSVRAIAGGFPKEVESTALLPGIACHLSNQCLVRQPRPLPPPNFGTGANIAGSVHENHCCQFGASLRGKTFLFLQDRKKKLRGRSASCNGGQNAQEHFYKSSDEESQGKR